MFEEIEPKLLNLEELIAKVRLSLENSQKQRKDYLALGDKEMADYAEGWQHALIFVLANTDEKWWKETERLNNA